MPACLRVRRAAFGASTRPNPLGTPADQFEYVANNLQQRGPRPPHEIVARALAFYQHGFGAYNCVVNNCEDFVMQCVYSNPPLLSDQTKVFTLDFVRTPSALSRASSHFACAAKYGIMRIVSAALPRVSQSNGGGRRRGARRESSKTRRVSVVVLRTTTLTRVTLFV